MPPKPARRVAPAQPGLLSLLNELNNRLPNFWYASPVILLLWLILYQFNILNYLIAWYVFCFFFGPHASFEWMGSLVKRSIRTYKGFPISYSITGFSICISRIFLIYPFETLLYCLDEILFFRYHETKIVDPFIIVGQPRSGTTKFETILEGDEDLICLKFYEARFPYLTFQYAVDAICFLDSHFLGNAIERIFKEYQFHHVYPETDGERATMRRLRYDQSDEDDLIFLFHFAYHFVFCAAFADPEIIYHMQHFDFMSKLEKRRLMEFHKKAVQKVLYRRGQGKRYFAKWVVPWCGPIQEAFEVYPDLKLLVMVRKPEEQLRSWFKLQGLLAKDLTGYNFISISKECLAAVKRVNADFYKKEIEFLNVLDPKKFKLLQFSQFYKDIQKSTRECYQFLDKEIRPNSEFEKFLKEQTQQQQSHKATATDDQYFTEVEIKQNFPDLTVVLFENLKKRLEAEKNKDE